MLSINGKLTHISFKLSDLAAQMKLLFRMERLRRYSGKHQTGTHSPMTSAHSNTFKFTLNKARQAQRFTANGWQTVCNLATTELYSSRAQISLRSVAIGNQAADSPMSAEVKSSPKQVENGPM